MCNILFLSLLIIAGILWWREAGRYLAIHFGRKWNRIEVDPANRGPNADRTYNGIVVNGQKYLFTDEAIDEANVRALKLWK